MGLFTKPQPKPETDEQINARNRQSAVNWKIDAMKFAVQAGRNDGFTIEETAQAIWEWLMVSRTSDLNKVLGIDDAPTEIGSKP